MNPWIATSFPLYDLIVSVSPESARIESTSWAKVSRGISSGPASTTEGTNSTKKVATSQNRNCCVTCFSLGQRRKVFRDFRSIRKHSRQQSGQCAQEDNARQNRRFAGVEEERIRNQPAP